MSYLKYKYRHNKPLREEVRFNHGKCGDTRGRLYVKRTQKGWVFLCHNCGFMGTHRRAKGYDLSPKQSLAELNQTLVKSQVNNIPLQLPYDFSTEIPNKGLIWLYKYEITDQEIKKYHMGYSKRLDRLILPVYNISNKKLIYWQGRNLGIVTKENPKYINIRDKEAKNVYFRVACNSNIDNIVVVVEDILSAIKVGRTLNSIALLGSYVADSLVSVLKEYNDVYIWLDYDKKITSIKYSNRLNILLNKKVKSLVTKKDPKEYATKIIKETIKNGTETVLNKRN